VQGQPIAPHSMFAAAAFAGVTAEPSHVASAGGTTGDAAAGARRTIALRGPCLHCGTTLSTQWRSGPEDKPVLCNACGLYYRKLTCLPDHTCQVAVALTVRLGTGASCWGH
jgi:hypothetical protein